MAEWHDECSGLPSDWNSEIIREFFDYAHIQQFNEPDGGTEMVNSWLDINDQYRLPIKLLSPPRAVSVSLPEIEMPPPRCNLFANLRDGFVKIFDIARSACTNFINIDIPRGGTPSPTPSPRSSPSPPPSPTTTMLPASANPSPRLPDVEVRLLSTGDSKPTFLFLVPSYGCAFDIYDPRGHCRFYLEEAERWVKSGEKKEMAIMKGEKNREEEVENEEQFKGWDEWLEYSDGSDGEEEVDAGERISSSSLKSLKRKFAEMEGALDEEGEIFGRGEGNEDDGEDNEKDVDADGPSPAKKAKA